MVLDSEAIFLPPEGIVSTTETRSRFRFFGNLILHSCSKWVCMGPSIVRKLHCSRPLSVVAAISLTYEQRQYIPQLLSTCTARSRYLCYYYPFTHIQLAQATKLPKKVFKILSCYFIDHKQLVYCMALYKLIQHSYCNIELPSHHLS